MAGKTISRHKEPTPWPPLVATFRLLVGLQTPVKLVFISPFSFSRGFLVGALFAQLMHGVADVVHRVVTRGYHEAGGRRHGPKVPYYRSPSWRQKSRREHEKESAPRVGGLSPSNVSGDPQCPAKLYPNPFMGNSGTIRTVLRRSFTVASVRLCTSIFVHPSCSCHRVHIYPLPHAPCLFAALHLACGRVNCCRLSEHRG